MIDVAKIYYFIFGALSILGGLMGFLKKSSWISLIAGGLCGVLLIIAGLMLREKPTPGLVLGLVISLALAGQFGMTLMHAKKHGHGPHVIPMLVLGLIGVIVSVLGFAKH
jgi:uncharacterized membrane protein (UPF0136 family)